LHKEGKPGFPNHVLAKCELRTYYTQNKINACEQSVRLRNGALTITETCTCDHDLCNDASLSAAKMIEIEKADGYRQSTSTAATPMTTPHEDVDDAQHEEDTEDHENDEAVESPTPVIKELDDDDDSEEIKSVSSVTEATKSTSQGEKIGAGFLMIVLQLVLFWGLVNPRW